MRKSYHYLNFVLSNLTAQELVNWELKLNFTLIVVNN